MLTSLTLAYMAGGKVTKSVVMDAKVPIEQQSQQSQAEGDAADTDTKSESKSE